jgi:hypothetical protein
MISIPSTINEIEMEVLFKDNGLIEFFYKFNYIRKY